MGKKFAVVIQVTEENKQVKAGYMRLADNFETAHWNSDTCSLNSADHYLKIFDRVKSSIKEKKMTKNFKGDVIIPHLLSFLFPDGYARSPSNLRGKVELILFSFEGTLLDLKTDRIAELSFCIKEGLNESDGLLGVELLGEMDYTNIKDLEYGYYM